MVYDKMVAAKRFEEIDPMLIKEFGDPQSTPEDVNYSGMTKDLLKKECDKLGLKYDSKSTKDDLVVLLENKSDEPEETPEEDQPEEEAE